MGRLRIPLGIAGVVAFCLAGVGIVALASVPAAATSIPTATSFNGTPAVGAVFLFGTRYPHTCAGTLIRSRGMDLVLTAAHCLSGNGQGVQFAPGYHNGVSPYGVWTVAGIYADPGWLATRNPQHDYAFLALAPHRIGRRTVRLHDLVRGYRLGTPPEKGSPITAIAYLLGRNDKPIRCATRTYQFAGYPAFNCHGFLTGTSGGPWVAGYGGRDPVVRGVIGGLHQGGCFEYTSYSPRWGQDIVRLYARANAGGPADLLPAAGGDGC